MYRLTGEEARLRFGAKLFVASLGVVVENAGAKIRVIHDASHGVHVNHRIRAQDQIRSPGPGELRTVIRDARDEKRQLFCICGDVAKAHRRVRIRASDHGYQCCRLEPGTVWVNGVGTYGLGSAAYWWSRVAGALMVRLLHHVLGHETFIELLLFADDELFAADSRDGGCPHRVWDLSAGGPRDTVELEEVPRREGNPVDWLVGRLCALPVGRLRGAGALGAGVDPVHT